MSVAPTPQGTVPMLVVCASDTMNSPAAPNTTTPRSFLTQEALKAITTQFSSATPGVKPGMQGGVRTFVATGNTCHDLGTLNEYTVRDALKQVSWTGTPALGETIHQIAQVYRREFAQDTPRLTTTILIDTIAPDAMNAVQELNQLNAPVDVNIAVLGFGNTQNDAVNTYRRLARENQNIRVIDLGGETHPEHIAERVTATFT